MKTKIYTSISVVVLLAIISFFWIQSCQKEVESTDSLFTKDIIKELAEANTPEKAEIAINHLFEKVGIGIPNKNSDYVYFKVNEEIVSNLGIAQSNFVNGNSAVTIGTSYSIFSKTMDRLKIVSDNKITFECTLNNSLQDLYKASIAAKNDEEKPNNALLLTISSENGIIPYQITQYDSTRIISPVQKFCFSLWMFNKYGNFNLNKNAVAVSLSLCEIACYALYAIQLSACDSYLPYFPDLYTICVHNADSALHACLAECHEGGSGS